ncbi:hypothetical protein [Nocardioides sp. BYT-33-1]|uniref:hypothetical protein n=1 Tax=Nocardioides sp. BYT-33-1 TaxID=3416952 RepID=UPI003F52C7BE
MNSAPVALWRLLIAACAASGVVLAAREYDVWWTALSQLANLAVAVCFLGLAVREPRSPWLRGALTTLMVLVGVAYVPMQNGNLGQAWSLLEHVVTPTLVVLDFVLVGRNHHQVRWWHPLSWLVPPTAYLLWYVGGDLAVYGALDAGRPAEFGQRVTALLGLLLATGYGLYRLGLTRRVSSEPL